MLLFGGVFLISYRIQDLCHCGPICQCYLIKRNAPDHLFDFRIFSIGCLRTYCLPLIGVSRELNTEMPLLSERGVEFLTQFKSSVPDPQGWQETLDVFQEPIKVGERVVEDKHALGATGGLAGRNDRPLVRVYHGNGHSLATRAGASGPSFSWGKAVV